MALLALAPHRVLPAATPTASGSFARLLFASLAASLASLVALPAAHAHFALRAPACFSEQDAFGSPQKSAPCGQSDPFATAVPTGAVTAYVQGGMITVTIEELIFHPGHYRIAIAPDMASLPADPPVTAGSTACGSTVIDPAPTLPLLADGVFLHTTSFAGPQTMQIPLPPGFTCDHCVLQVIEFMSNHPLNNPGGCFYHHCATVTVAPPNDAGLADASGTDTMPDDVTSTDATSPGDSGAMNDATGSDTSATIDGSDAGTVVPPAARGCGCRAGSSSRERTAGMWNVALAAALTLTVTRRRRTRSSTRRNRET